MFCAGGTRAQRTRLASAGVSDAQLVEGAALLAAVQAQLSGGVGVGVGAQAPPRFVPPSPVRSRKPPPAPPVDSGATGAESWPFFAESPEDPASDPFADAVRISPRAEDPRVVHVGVGSGVHVGTDGWPAGFGAEPAARATRRRPNSVSGTRPSSFGGSAFGRPSTSEGVRTFGRPSTSEGARTFGRPSTSEGPRVRGSSPSRPSTVEGTRSRPQSSDGWSGHGDGASWFRQEQQAAKREQAATKEAEERWRAHFDAEGVGRAPRQQDSWERRQAQRRAAEEKSERRAAEFRAQKTEEKKKAKEQSVMDDIFSEAEADLQRAARRRALAKEKAAREKAVRERAAREQQQQAAARDISAREPEPFNPTRTATPAEADCSASLTDDADAAALSEYYNDDLLEAWDAVCSGHGGRNRMLDVDEVGQLLNQLGKPVGSYELRYIVSKVGDETTGRVGLPAFCKWWDAVLREFAEWCATQRGDSPPESGQGNGGATSQWQPHSSCSSSRIDPRQQREATAAAAAVARLSSEELAATAKQQVDAARAAAVASSHAEAERLRWERHIAEKQHARVLAHRGAEKQKEEEAVAKREFVSRVTDRLARKVRGKNFVAVLRMFGLPVAPAANGAAVHKAYRRALAQYHPDRATRQGLSWQKAAEAEATFTMLQTQYDLYLEVQQQHQLMYGNRRH